MPVLLVYHTSTPYMHVPHIHTIRARTTHPYHTCAYHTSTPHVRVPHIHTIRARTTHPHHTCTYHTSTPHVHINNMCATCVPHSWYVPPIPGTHTHMCTPCTRAAGHATTRLTCQPHLNAAHMPTTHRILMCTLVHTHCSTRGICAVFTYTFYITTHTHSHTNIPIHARTHTHTLKTAHHST